MKKVNPLILIILIVVVALLIKPLFGTQSFVTPTSTFTYYHGFNLVGFVWGDFSFLPKSLYWRCNSTTGYLVSPPNPEPQCWQSSVEMKNPNFVKSAYYGELLTNQYVSTYFTSEGSIKNDLWDDGVWSWLNTYHFTLDSKFVSESLGVNDPVAVTLGKR